MPTKRLMAAGFLPFAPTGFAQKYRGAVFAPPDDPPTVESLQATIASQAARITELNAESAGHRLAAGRHKTAAEAAAGERDALRGEVDTLRPQAETAKQLQERLTAEAAARTAAEAAATEAAATVKATRTATSLEVAATRAGILDLDGLKLIDRAGLELNDDGSVKDGAAVMAALKEQKPYLFGAPGTTPATTERRDTTGSQASPPKPAGTGAGKSAMEMTDEEYKAALKGNAWRKK